MGTEAGTCTEQRCCAGRRYFCSVELALQVIGGKWKPIILWHLRSGQSRRFGELRRSMPNVTQKMLTQQLRELEGDGLLLRTVHPQVPPKVEYALTDLGASVLPVLDQLCRWGAAFEASQPVRGDVARSAL
ncbi:MAG: helix-turn-helix transcriptional regulator [Desulfovibrio sp.]|jgi:DNA-binding HxlR family transcriptional regulator|nr:helix-turn-helix transcriptional regulator [Desulfovibrio sp.]